MTNTQQYSQNSTVFARNNWARALPLLLCVGLLGCADREAIQQNQAALELAEMKGDLDAMYLALRRLDELGVREASDKLPVLRVAVESRERMLRAIADHDHEQALLAANLLLDQFPNDKDALTAVRTSGHIFWHLQKATEQLSSVGLLVEAPIVSPEDVAWSLPETLSADQHQIELNKLAQQALEIVGKYSGQIDGKIGSKTKQAISEFTKDEGIAHSGEVDAKLVDALRIAARKRQLRQERIDSSFYNLAQARQSIAKAKELDPSFKNIVQLEAMTGGALDALVYLQGAQMATQSEQIVAMAAYMQQGIANEMSSSLGRAVGPSAVWEIFKPSVEAFLSDTERTLKELDVSNRRLSQYGEGAAKEFASAVNEFYVSTTLAIDACTNPRGSLVDYRRDAHAALQRYRESADRLKSRIPPTQNVDESFKALAVALEGYRLYSDPQVKEIVEKRVQGLTS